MKLAAATGLPTATTEIGNVEGLDYLLVERYDRRHHSGPDGVEIVQRLHQEDFCQTLGIVRAQIPEGRWPDVEAMLRPHSECLQRAGTRPQAPA